MNRIMVFLFAFSLFISGWAAPQTTIPTTLKMSRCYSNHMVLQRDVPLKITGDVAPGTPVTVVFAGQSATAIANPKGVWTTEFTPIPAGGPFEMKISGRNQEIVFTDVMVGEVFFCSGQSNMYVPLKESDNGNAEIAASSNSNLRLFSSGLHLSPQEIIKEPVHGTWQVSSPQSTTEFSAVAYYFGKMLQQKLKVPVGMVASSFGGTPIEAWIGLDAYRKAGDTQLVIQVATTLLNPEAVKKLDWNFPTTLYNCMVAPWMKYQFRGVLWYQGETNAGNPPPYWVRFPLLIKSWREGWKNPRMPFLFVQLAAHERHDPSKPLPEGYFDKKPPGENNGWSELREAQAGALAIPNTGMAVTIDIGDPINIHPGNKQEVARRLYLEALRIIYGEKSLVSAGPLYERMRVDGNRIRIYFKNAGSCLTSKDNQPLRNFAIAGADGTYHWAKAEISGKNIVDVSCPEVVKPVAVRYAWAMCPVNCNLVNKEGLPAGPFRTNTPPNLRIRY